MEALDSSWRKVASTHNLQASDLRAWRSMPPRCTHGSGRHQACLPPSQRSPPTTHHVAVPHLRPAPARDKPALQALPHHRVRAAGSVPALPCSVLLCGDRPAEWWSDHGMTGSPHAARRSVLVALAVAMTLLEGFSLLSKLLPPFSSPTAAAIQADWCVPRPGGAAAQATAVRSCCSGGCARLPPLMPCRAPIMLAAWPHSSRP